MVVWVFDWIACGVDVNPPLEAPQTLRMLILRGSWDLVIRVINKVTIVIVSYNSN